MSEFDDKEDQMSAKDMAMTFGVPVPKEKELPVLSLLSREEIEKLERAEVESSDIYRISARVMNQARSGGGSLTPVGQQLCNLYVHVMKSLYEFGDSLDENKKEELKALLRKHESFPGQLLSLTRRK